LATGCGLSERAREFRRAPRHLLVDRHRVIILWGALIVVFVTALAVAVMLLVRRGAPEGGYFSDSDRASGVFGVLATGFAIFAGFVIFLGFTSYDVSRSGAEAEALTVAQQYETAQFMPANVRSALSGELVCYGRSVVHQEWPLMRDGKVDDTLNPWGVALFLTLKGASPQSNAEQAAYSKWLDQTSDREEARRDRLHGASGIIPASIWIVLLAVAVVVFAYILLYADSGERARAQAMLMGSAAAVVTVTLLAIYSFDNPYRKGPGSIDPVWMARSLGVIDQARAQLGDSGPLPCDETGKAVRA
jgi:amino acid transporter